MLDILTDLDECFKILTKSFSPDTPRLLKTTDLKKIGSFHRVFRQSNRYHKNVSRFLLPANRPFEGQTPCFVLMKYGNMEWGDRCFCGLNIESQLKAWFSCLSEVFILVYVEMYILKQRCLYIYIFIYILVFVY